MWKTHGSHRNMTGWTWDEHRMTMGWLMGWTCNGIQLDIWGRNWIFSWDMCDDTLVTSVTWMICMIFLINPLLNDLILFFFESPGFANPRKQYNSTKMFYSTPPMLPPDSFGNWAANVSYVSNVGLWERLVFTSHDRLKWGVPEGRPKREQWNSHLWMTQLARQGENAFGAHLGHSNTSVS